MPTLIEMMLAARASAIQTPFRLVWMPSRKRLKFAYCLRDSFACGDEIGKKLNIDFEVTSYSARFLT